MSLTEFNEALPVSEDQLAYRHSLAMIRFSGSRHICGALVPLPGFDMGAKFTSAGETVFDEVSMGGTYSEDRTIGTAGEWARVRGHSAAGSFACPDKNLFHLQNVPTTPGGVTIFGKLDGDLGSDVLWESKFTIDFKNGIFGIFPSQREE